MIHAPALAIGEPNEPAARQALSEVVTLGVRRAGQLVSRSR
jgi:hypothetical protein